MTVFALNDANAAGVATLSVEPVCLADAGGQALIGKYLQLTTQSDVDDFVHGHAPVVFPMHPTEPQLGASVKNSGLRAAYQVIRQFGQHLDSRMGYPIVGRLSGLSVAGHQ